MLCLFLINPVAFGDVGLENTVITSGKPAPSAQYSTGPFTVNSGLQADGDFKVYADDGDLLMWIDVDQKISYIGNYTDGNYLKIYNGAIIDYVGSSAGLIQGELSVTSNSTQTTLNSSGYVQVTIFDTNGPSLGMTPDHTQDHITSSTAGKYTVWVSVSVSNEAAQDHMITLAAHTNNGFTILTNVEADRNLTGGSGDVGSISLNGTVILSANDTVELWALTDSASDRDVTFDDITMTVIKTMGN